MNLAAMQAGRSRAQSQRRAHAIQRVQAFRAWSKAHAAGRADIREIPEIPSDHDYAVLRESGRKAA